MTERLYLLGEPRTVIGSTPTYFANGIIAEGLGRRGGDAQGSGNLTLKGEAAKPHVPEGIRFGMAVRFANSFESSTNGFLRFNIVSTNARFYLNADGTITAKYGTTDLGTSAKAFTLDQWYYVEVLYKLGPAGTGRATVVVDGEVWLDITDKAMGSVLTGNVSGSSSTHIVTTYTPAGTGLMYMNDLYVWNSPESYFLGDIAVFDVTPTSDAIENNGFQVSRPTMNATNEPGSSITFALGVIPPEFAGEPVAAVASMSFNNSGGTTLTAGVEAFGVNSGQLPAGVATVYAHVQTLAPTDLSTLKVTTG